MSSGNSNIGSWLTRLLARAVLEGCHSVLIPLSIPLIWSNSICLAACCSIPGLGLQSYNITIAQVQACCAKKAKLIL